MIDAQAAMLPPKIRRLRIYSHDPAAKRELDTLDISQITIGVRWENLGPGPVGEYIQVLDVDPPSRCFYPPLDLHAREHIATDGLEPSESNPQFHQQMVYAVAMATIAHFERALGRPAMWADRVIRDENNRVIECQFVRRLRIYPHAIRDRNAYYSPEKKAVLFGYFPNEFRDRKNTPGTLVFTAASHDIIAHEVTHALLDGARPYFAEQTNADVLAFHEAFADLVALFQHFAYPDVLADQIARIRGEIDGDSLLGQLAQEFGHASGRGEALRSYLGHKREDEKWQSLEPNPRLIESTTEAHDRGAILVAAVFGAFAKVYRRRSRDLYRIASDGTGILRPGEIHPDLVNRLSGEAADAADHMLKLCIRAIDYCPPANITFGDYLRALVTADYDADEDDRHGYRTALIESFREWGIYPRDVKSMSVESLLWPSGEKAIEEVIAAKNHNGMRAKAAAQLRKRALEKLNSILKKMLGGFPYSSKNDDSAEKLKEYAAISTIPERIRIAPDGEAGTAASPEDDRFNVWQSEGKECRSVWNWLYGAAGELDEDVDVRNIISDALGFRIHPSGDKPKSIRRVDKSGGFGNLYRLQIGSVRTALRGGLLGQPRMDIVIEIVQTRDGSFDPRAQEDWDKNGKETKQYPDFKYRAGCTLLVDAISNRIRRVVRTEGGIENDLAFERLRHFLVTDDDLTNAFAGPGESLRSRETFALVHRQPVSALAADLKREDRADG